MLPEPQVPFAVSSDHRVRPDLVRLEGPAFRLDSEYPRYLRAKREQFGLPWTSLEAPWADPVAIQTSLAHLANRLAQEHPEHYQSHFEAFGQEAKDSALALALSVQEDLVLMKGHRLEALWVCFPSNWNPLHKIGHSFAEIHAPVPHSDKLQAAQANLTTAMSQKGPFMRHVWSLSFDPSLSAHPDRPQVLEGQQVYFRTERQITLPMPELGRSWFLIRVYVVPIESVVDSAERRAALRKAMQTMPPAHQEYKSSTVAAYERLEQIGFFD